MARSTRPAPIPAVIHHQLSLETTHRLLLETKGLSRPRSIVPNLQKGAESETPYPLAEGFGRGGLEQEGEIRGFSYGQYIHLFFVSPDLDRVGRGVCVCVKRPKRMSSDPLSSLRKPQTLPNGRCGKTSFGRNLPDGSESQRHKRNVQVDRDETRNRSEHFDRRRASLSGS